MSVYKTHRGGYMSQQQRHSIANELNQTNFTLGLDQSSSSTRYASEFNTKKDIQPKFQTKRQNVSNVVFGNQTNKSTTESTDNYTHKVSKSLNQSLKLGKQEGESAHFHLGNHPNIMATQVTDSFKPKKPVSMMKELSAIQQRMKKVNLVISQSNTGTDKSIASTDFVNQGPGRISNGQKSNQNRANSLSLGDVAASYQSEASDSFSLSTPTKKYVPIKASPTSIIYGKDRPTTQTMSQSSYSANLIPMKAQIHQHNQNKQQSNFTLGNDKETKRTQSQETWKKGEMRNPIIPRRESNVPLHFKNFDQPTTTAYMDNYKKQEFKKPVGPTSSQNVSHFAMGYDAKPTAASSSQVAYQGRPNTAQATNAADVAVRIARMKASSILVGSDLAKNTTSAQAAFSPRDRSPPERSTTTKNHTDVVFGTDKRDHQSTNRSTFVPTTAQPMDTFKPIPRGVQFGNNKNVQWSTTVASNYKWQQPF